MDSDWELNSHNNDQDNEMAAEGYQSEDQDGEYYRVRV